MCVHASHRRCGQNAVDTYMAKYFCNDSYCDSRSDVLLGAKTYGDILVVAMTRILPRSHPIIIRQRCNETNDTIFNIKVRAISTRAHNAQIIFFVSLPCHSNVRHSPFAVVRHAHWCQPLWFVSHWMVAVNVQPFRMFPPLDFVCSVRWVRIRLGIVHRRRHRIYCPAIGSWRALLCRLCAPIIQNRRVYFAIHAPKMNRFCHVPISIFQLLCPIDFHETICWCRKTKKKKKRKILIFLLFFENNFNWYRTNRFYKYSVFYLFIFSSLENEWIKRWMSVPQEVTNSTECDDDLSCARRHRRWRRSVDRATNCEKSIHRILRSCVMVYVCALCHYSPSPSPSRHIFCICTTQN